MFAKNLVWAVLAILPFQSSSAEELVLDPAQDSVASNKAQTHRLTIKRDTFGTPHIYADTPFGLFYGYGYAVAEDRLFQMEMAKRSFTGTVAEVLGPSYVDFDKSIRSNYDPNSIRRQYAALGPRDRAIFEGYAAGFNARLREVLSQPEVLLPKQFKDFDFLPTPWTAFDVLAIFVGSMAIRFSDANAEIANLSLLTHLKEQHGDATGQQIFDQLRWINDPLAPTTVSREEQKAAAASPDPAALHRLDSASPRTTPARAAAIGHRLKGHLSGLRPISTASAERYQADQWAVNRLTGPGRFPEASNYWSTGRSKTHAARAALVNGPQFGWFNPSYVYGIGLHGAGFEVVGNTPFAPPVILFGTNGHIAWGATAGLGDTVDMYQETLNPANPHEYLFEGKFQPMEKRTESIPVKGGDPVTLEVYRTRHGLVVSFDLTQGTAYAKRRTWDGRELESLLGWIGSMQAKNFTQWRKQAARMAITINWYYADKEGNIGYIHTGLYPIRPTNQDRRLPAVGSGAMEWQGFKPFSTNPQVYNPHEGFIVNWNNKPMPSYDNSDFQYWSVADRVDVLFEELRAKPEFTPDELWDINKRASFVDVNARYFVPIILEAVNALPQDDEAKQIALLLKDWNHRAEDVDRNGFYDSPAVTVLRTWLPIMIADTLQDDIPAEDFAAFSGAGYLGEVQPLAATSINIANGSKVVYNALLGDKAGVPQVYDFFDGEDPNVVVLDALRKTAAQLKAHFGSETQTWLTPVTRIDFRPVNFLGIPQAGADETLSSQPFMNRGTENNLIAFGQNGVTACDVVAPGQSGHIGPDGEKSAHYQDQLELYQNFDCKPVLLDPRDLDQHLESVKVIAY